MLVDQEAVLALAHRLVKIHLALLVGVTGESGAGVNTLLVLSVAGLGQRTVLVTGAALANLWQGDGATAAAGAGSAGH